MGRILALPRIVGSTKTRVGAYRAGARAPFDAPKLAVAAALPFLVGTSVWLALVSDHLRWPLATALFRSYLIAAPLLIGLLWWVRRPSSRFGPLLVAYGFVAWPLAWQASDQPLLFDVGAFADAPFALFTFYLCLAFPLGRLETRVERALMAGLAAVILGFFLPWTLLSSRLDGSGPLAGCAVPCPENVLQPFSAPGLLELFYDVTVYCGLALVFGILVAYLWRLSSATRPRRRALMAVAVTSLLLLPVYLAYHVWWLVLEGDAATTEALGWMLVAAQVVFPLGFLLALLHSELFARRALGRLLTELATRPAPERWRDAVAGALDDPALRLGVWDAHAMRFVETDGTELLPPPRGDGRLWMPVRRGGQTFAGIVTDAVLVAEPELLQAAAEATVLAVENGRLELELRASRAGIVEAGDAVRRRLARDLHDSAQQRLIALRVRLDLARDGGDSGLDALSVGIDEALAELRSIASGLYPPLLARYGVGEALRSVARAAAIPVTVEDDGFGRHTELVESTTYFCCLEALQNAAKHAGSGARAAVRLSADPHVVRFAVVDDGVGFDPDRVERGSGLASVADRAAATGGTLSIDTAPGRGTRISGRLPVTDAVAQASV